MDVHLYITFVVATTLMIALPGPSVLLTVAHSIAFGGRAALATVAGATLGIAVQLLVATIGLTSVLHLVADTFNVLRWGGAAYLVYLGLRQWRSAGASPSWAPATVSSAHLLLQGLLITIPNPKSLIFIAAFLPQFIDGARPLGPQFAVMVPTFLAITFAVTALWALAAGRLRHYLRRPRAVATISRTAGGLMVAAGMGLALARRSG